MSGEMARLAERKTAAETELNTTASKLWEEYQLTEAEAEKLCVPFANVADLRRQVAEVRGKIRALGNVNVGAIEEYKELRTVRLHESTGHRCGEIPRGAEPNDCRAVQRNAGDVHRQL